MKILPRISLLTSLLVMTCLALGISLWQMGQEIVPLRNSIRDLRKELGQFVVHDESRVHVQRGKTITGKAWKWRIYLPSGKQYSLFVTEGNLSELSPTERAKWFAQNRDQQTSIGDLESGQCTLEVSIEKYGGSWWMCHQTRNELHNLVQLKSRDSWYEALQAEEQFSDASYERVSQFAADEPVVLLSVRRGKKVQVAESWVTEQVPGDAESFVIWMKPANPSSQKIPPGSIRRRTSLE